MKDIEILVKFAKEYKDRGYFGIIKAERIQILDNLLKERQADKEKIKELNEGLDNSSSRVTALTRENTKLKHEVFNSIPKAIIEDKIEELKHKDFIKLQVCYQHDNKALVQIEVLEELLKGEGE